MGNNWSNFCCQGYDFIVLKCDSGGYGHGLCMNPNCPHGDALQGFELDSYAEDDEGDSLEAEIP